MNPPDIPRTPPPAVNRPAGRPGPARFLARLMELIDRWPLRLPVKSGRLPVKSGRLPLARRLAQWPALALALTLTLIGAAGCVQAVERPGIETPTPVVILVPAPTPAPTATPASPPPRPSRRAHWRPPPPRYPHRSPRPGPRRYRRRLPHRLHRLRRFQQARPPRRRPPPPRRRHPSRRRSTRPS